MAMTEKELLQDIRDNGPMCPQCKKCKVVPSHEINIGKGKRGERYVMTRCPRCKIDLSLIRREV